MSRIRSLRGLWGTLSTLTFFYALSLLLVLPITLLLGSLVLSLFRDELFTQGIFLLVYGTFFMIIGGIIDLVCTIVMVGLKTRLKASLGKGSAIDRTDGSRVLYIIFPVLLISSSILVGALSIGESGAFLFLSFWGAVIFVFYFLKWKVIDVPAKALALMGNEKGLKRARLSAVPLIIFVFSLLALAASFRYDDAPISTIVVVYLEVLYATSVLINLFSIGGLTKDINEEIASWEKVMEVNPGFERV
ncbi:MAG: hypothetical protein ACMUHB_04135 [Thermoplasmatota archaeon]